MMNQTYLPHPGQALVHTQQMADAAGRSPDCQYQRRVYIEIDCGIIQHIAGCLILNLSLLYGVAISNFLNEFNQFLYDGQAKWIKD